MNSSETLISVLFMIIGFIAGCTATGSGWGGTAVFLFIVVAHLGSALTKSNPFERRLSRGKYTVSASCLDRYDCSISFAEDATIDSLREAIFNAMYQKPHSSWEYRDPSIGFGNFIKWNSIADSFRPFHFSTISFDDVAPDTFRCNDFLFLPCEQLVLPRRINSIDFLGYSIPHIKEIVIRSEHFVCLVPHADYSADPFKSPVPINIIVPQKLLAQYRKDPVWSSLRFIDEDGKIKTATFNGFPPIDPSKQSRCIHC